MSTEKVVVVGAGLVGSMAAIYMARLGYDVVLYEKRSDTRKMAAVEGRSINLALSVRGLTALKGIGLDTTVLELAIPMKGRMIHAPDGRGTTAIPYGDFGEVINSVSRRGLNEILLDAAEELPNVTLCFEEELLSLDANTGELQLRNKASGRITSETADLVLGCDGAYSVVRREMMRFTRMDFSQSYIRHGYKEFCIPADETGKWKMELNYLHIWPRHRFMLIALPNPDGTFTATLFYPHEMFADVRTGAEAVQLFRDNFPDALELIGESRIAVDFAENPVGSLVTMRCSHYHHSDKVLLLGDAAHAMVPFYGQGMNAGFEDLTVLSSLLTTHGGRAAALEEYSRRRHADAQAICDLALYNYWEMSSAVTSRWFRFKRALYGRLHRLLPNVLVPLYSMVSFSNIPYAQVVRRHARQERLLGWLLGLSGAGVLSLLGLAVARRLRS